MKNRGTLLRELTANSATISLTNPRSSKGILDFNNNTHDREHGGSQTASFADGDMMQQLERLRKARSQYVLTTCQVSMSTEKASPRSIS